MKRMLPVLVSLLGLSAACADEGGRERTDGPSEYQGPAPEIPGSMAPGAAGSGSAVPGTYPPSSGGSASEEPGSGLPLDPPDAPPPVAPEELQAVALPRSTPEAEGLSSEGVLGLVAALDDAAAEIHSVMLVRHGKVVAEGWWAPYAAEDIHVLYSVTKSFNATAVGFAAAEGKLSVDDLLLSHFADIAPAAPSPQMQNMRIRDLLTMSTGHQADTINTLRARADGQWTRAFLETNVQQPPGTLFVYNSGAAYMLGALVQKVTGMSVEEYLQPRLFKPLGILSPLWGKSAEGVNLTDGGLSIRTEDLAKFGLLYLQKGMWAGEQLLSEQWVADATSSQVSTGSSNANYGYGYQFWRSQVGYRADGSLGQFSFVLPDQDIVLAVTAATNDMEGIKSIVFQKLLPAVTEAALPENPAARDALGARLAALALPVPVGSVGSSTMTDVSARRYAVQSNSQGILAVQLDFSAEQPVLSIEDADGTHAINVGLGAWVRGRTRFKKRINELFVTPEQGISAMGAWTAEDTFTAKLCFNETPYVMNASFKFDAERVLVDMSYNIRWGSSTEPQLVGTR